MTINFNTEVVSTAYDKTKKECRYTLERGGRRWTVSIPLKTFESFGPVHSSKRRRIEHIGKLLQTASRGPADGEM